MARQMIRPMTDLMAEYWTFRGMTLNLPLEGLTVKVKVLDVRQRWNVLDALVTPVSGSGEKWIEARRLEHPIINNDEREKGETPI